MLGDGRLTFHTDKGSVRYTGRIRQDKGTPNEAPNPSTSRPLPGKFYSSFSRRCMAYCITLQRSPIHFSSLRVVTYDLDASCIAA